MIYQRIVLTGLIVLATVGVAGLMVATFAGRKMGWVNVMPNAPPREWQQFINFPSALDPVIKTIDRAW